MVCRLVAWECRESWSLSLSTKTTRIFVGWLLGMRVSDITASLSFDICSTGNINYMKYVLTGCVGDLCMVFPIKKYRACRWRCYECLYFVTTST